MKKILIHLKLKCVGSLELMKHSSSLKLRIDQLCQWKQKSPAWDSAGIQMNSVACPETGGNRDQGRILKQALLINWHLKGKVAQSYCKVSTISRILGYCFPNSFNPYIYLSPVGYNLCYKPLGLI